MAYITNSDAASYLNITLTSVGQTQIDGLITGYSAALDNYCNRNWRQDPNVAITEKFDATANTFFIKYPDIDESKPYSVTIGNVVVPSQYTISYGSFIEVWTFPIVWSLPSFIWLKAVTVSYFSTATSIPADLKQALIQWVALAYQTSADADRQAQSVSAGTVKVDYIAARNQQQPAMPSFVKMVADNYRLQAIDRR